MVEVFKTNVSEHHQAAMLEGLLSGHFPLFRINFDIEDCDNILRIEGDKVPVDRIIDILAGNGYNCHILE
jgi:hypothetical protein